MTVFGRRSSYRIRSCARAHLKDRADTMRNRDIAVERVRQPRYSVAMPKDHSLAGALAMVTITVNDTQHQLDIEPDTPLLWVLRDVVGLTGTKYGCGIAQCGACTVHIDGKPMRSCSVPIGALDGAKVATIEGLSPDNSHPVQRAWIAEDVPQCGYCQSGQIMATVAFLKEFPNPTDADIDANITNICRCGTYERLRRAIHRAADMMKA